MSICLCINKYRGWKGGATGGSQERKLFPVVWGLRFSSLLPPRLPRPGPSGLAPGTGAAEGNAASPCTALSQQTQGIPTASPAAAGRQQSIVGGDRNFQIEVSCLCFLRIKARHESKLVIVTCYCCWEGVLHQDLQIEFCSGKFTGSVSVTTTFHLHSCFSLALLLWQWVSPLRNIEYFLCQYYPKKTSMHISVYDSPFLLVPSDHRMQKVSHGAEHAATQEGCGAPHLLQGVVGTTSLKNCIKDSEILPDLYFVTCVSRKSPASCSLLTTH